MRLISKLYCLLILDLFFIIDYKVKHNSASATEDVTATLPSLPPSPHTSTAAAAAAIYAVRCAKP